MLTQSEIQGYLASGITALAQITEKADIDMTIHCEFGEITEFTVRHHGTGKSISCFFPDDEDIQMVLERVADNVDL